MAEMPMGPENFGDEARDFENGIRFAGNFDDLYEVLQDAQVIEGDEKTYTFQEIKDSIEKVRETIERSVTGGGRIEKVHQIPLVVLLPSAHGLREKVIELLQKEKDELSSE